MMPLLFALLLVVVLMACWGLTLLGMPGNWLMVAAAAVYAFFMPPESTVAISWQVVAGLLVLAIVGEVVEFLAGAMGVAKAGGSRRGAVLALLGSIVGALVGLVVGLPIPLIGSVVAAVLFAGLGAMAGAILGETWAGSTADKSWQVAKLAFWGRLAGTLGKVLVGAAMIGVALAAMLL